LIAVSMCRRIRPFFEKRSALEGTKNFMRLQFFVCLKMAAKKR